MGALRQFVQMEGARPAAAARAHELPAHREETDALGGEKQRHRIVRAGRPTGAPSPAGGWSAARQPARAAEIRRASARGRGSSDRARDRRSAPPGAGAPRASPLPRRWRRSSRPACRRRSSSRSQRVACRPRARSGRRGAPASPRRPTHSISEENVAVDPSPSGSSSAAARKPRKGPLRKWRVCTSRRFACHSPKLSSQRIGSGPNLAVAMRRMRPSASARSWVAWVGKPLSSLMRAVSAMNGQIASGGLSKRRSFR